MKLGVLWLLFSHSNSEDLGLISYRPSVNRVSHKSCTISRCETYVLSDFFRVEVGVSPLISVIHALVLSEGPCSPHCRVIGMELSVNHQAPVVHEARVVDGCVTVLKQLIIGS